MKKSSRFPGPRNQMLCRRRKNLAARPVQTRRAIWLQMGSFLQPNWGEMWALGVIPYWTWSTPKVQSVQLWESERVKGQQTGFGGLWSCIRWERTIVSCTLTGSFTKAKVFSPLKDEILFSCLLAEKCTQSLAIVYSPHVHVKNTQGLTYM